MKSVFLSLSGVYFDEGRTPDIDLRSIEGTVCYCSEEAAASLRAAIAGIPTDAVHWIDTGDFHYLTLLFLERITEPFSLVLFDHHSDDRKSAFETEEMLGCGSWVADAKLRLRQMREVISIGPDDCAAEGLYAEASFPVYLSIDLDVLAKSEFSTDWDQGVMTLRCLLDAVTKFASKQRIIGIDICGGITAAQGASGCELTANAAVRDILVNFFENY